jgi:regulator of protease activity HflC (stomatin/prohibitin superfamily)
MNISKVAKAKKGKKVFISGLAGALMLTMVGCTSKVVPPGTVVIVLQADGDSSIHARGSYTSWGRDRIYFVDTKLKSFTESMRILCKDDVNMVVDIKWVGSFKVSDDNISTIKEKVPATEIKSGDIKGYQLSLDKFYATAMKDIVRANSRMVVSQYSTDSIRANRTEIQTKINDLIRNRFKKLGYPIHTTDIMVSNLDYPKEINDQRKAIKNAQLEDKKQEALSIAAIKQASRAEAIAVAEGKAAIARAYADAKSNEVRSKTLTPEIIQMKQWDVLESLAGKFGEGDVLIMPYSSLSDKDSIMMRQAIKRVK